MEKVLHGSAPAEITQMTHRNVYLVRPWFLQLSLIITLFSATLSISTQALSGDHLTKVKTTDAALRKNSDGTYSTAETEEFLLKHHLGDKSAQVMIDRAKANEVVSEKIKKAVAAARLRAEAQKQNEIDQPRKKLSTAAYLHGPSLRQRLRDAESAFNARF